MTSLGNLTYFPLMAMGLGVALACELSGLLWRGPRDTFWKRTDS